MEVIEVMIEEYKSLREEVRSSIYWGHSVLAVGLAALGLLISSAISSNADNKIIEAGLILTFAIPIISFLILQLWLTEALRLRRSSWYLWGLERRINTLLGNKALGWEEGLRSGIRTLPIIHIHYWVVVLVFSGASIISEYLGGLLLHLFFFPRTISLMIVVILTLVVSIVQIQVLIKQFDIPDPTWPPKLNGATDQENSKEEPDKKVETD
jgi:hypothetical protein